MIRLWTYQQNHRNVIIRCKPLQCFHSSNMTSVVSQIVVFWWTPRVSLDILTPSGIPTPWHTQTRASDTWWTSRMTTNFDYPHFLKSRQKWTCRLMEIKLVSRVSLLCLVVLFFCWTNHVIYSPLYLWYLSWETVIAALNLFWLKRLKLKIPISLFSLVRLSVICLVVSKFFLWSWNGNVLKLPLYLLL